jgi:hypothetical protein
MKTRLRERWFMIAALGLFLLGDCAVTLLGQPHSYWVNHAMTKEASPVWNYLLKISPWHCLCGFVLYWVAASLIAALLPRFLSLLYGTTLIYMHSLAIYCWLTWNFHCGWWTELWFAPLAASVILATYCFQQPRKKTPER